MLRKSVIVVSLLIGSLSTVSAVQATSLCGVKTHEKYGETRAHFGPSLATLRPDGSGHLVLYNLDKSAPLGWSHSLRVFKESKAADWQVQVVDVNADALTKDSFTFTVDKNRKSHFMISLEEERLVNTGSVNEWTLALDEEEPLVDAIKNGIELVWSYQRSNDMVEEVEFSLKGTRKAMAWVKCGLNRA